MNFNLKKYLIISIAAMLSSVQTFGFDLDETVNDEIRKNYNDTKLIEDSGVNFGAETSAIDENLPDLPNITKQQRSPKASDIKTPQNNAPQTLPVVKYSSGNIKIKKGTKFVVSNVGAISDWQAKGTTVKFKTGAQLTGKNYTIPAGTVFNGEIVDVHKPQITCNGGLVAIKVYSMLYHGQTCPINAYVVRANDKKVFFNDIKGDRTYLKTMWKKGNWGRNLFNRMMNLTVNLGSKNSTLILSPFPFAYGTICLGATTLVSPVTAFFSKGGHVSIPAGNKFVLKLNEDAFLD